MLLISEASAVVPVRSRAVALRGLMAAEIDEHADAYFLANRLERLYSEFKDFSWIMSPLIVVAGPLLGGLVSDSSMIGFGAGGLLGGLAALGFNLSGLRLGKRARKARNRYENLDVELLLCESDFKRDLSQG